MSTTFSTLASMTLTSAEKQTVAAAVGFEDAQGMLSAINVSLAETLIQLQRLATYVPSGTNLTAINAAITALQS